MNKAGTIGDRSASRGWLSPRVTHDALPDTLEPVRERQHDRTLMVDQCRRRKAEVLLQRNVLLRHQYMRINPPSSSPGTIYRYRGTWEDCRYEWTVPVPRLLRGPNNGNCLDLLFPKREALE
jgi:hypothetical protein